ncbi:hypothetical protein Tco_0522159 [Tanacetum coccineum]
MLNHLYNLYIILYLPATDYFQKIPIKFCPRRPGDATEVYVSSDKAASELDWKMMQIAEASNLRLNEDVKMFEEYKRFAKIWNVIKGLQHNKNEDMIFLFRYMNTLQEIMLITPQFLRVRIKDDHLQKLLKQMECSLATALAQEDA